jgi:MFS superfamily sulfate permease-like transporter
MINVNNGATQRLSGIALLSFILFLSDWIELIPIAALVGLMSVSQKTFVASRGAAPVPATPSWYRSDGDHRVRDLASR